MLDATFELLTAEPEVTTQKPVIDNRQLVATVEQPLRPLEPAKRVVKTTPIRVTVTTAEEPDATALALTNDSTPEDGALSAIAAVARASPRRSSKWLRPSLSWSLNPWPSPSLPRRPSPPTSASSQARA